MSGGGVPSNRSAGPAALELIDVCCPCCASTERAAWATENGYTAWRCHGCRLIYVSPRPIELLRSEAERTGSHRTSMGTLEVTGAYSRAREARLAARMVRLLGRSLRSTPRRWLDVGSGHGELQSALRHLLAPGSEILGVEPNEAKRRGATRRGLDVVASLDDVVGTFDVISLMNVYGHLAEPRAALAALTDRLEVGGLLVLETGNAADLPDRRRYPGPLDLPDHLTFAGRDQLTRMLAEAGLQVRTVQGVRLDGLVGTTWELVRGRRRSGRRRWLVPYTSPFRDLHVVAARPTSKVT